ncbi:MAG: type II toxin-antitoxin system RelE/ParE family toxin [Phycisphaerae bacterium]
MSKEADGIVVVRGSSRIIEYAVCANGKMPAKEFIEGLPEADQRKIAVLLHRMAEKGDVPNRQQFKPVRGKLFEFKKHQIRVFCFRNGDRWLLTNGYKKKTDRLDSGQIRWAETVMQEHLQRERRKQKGRET